MLLFFPFSLLGLFLSCNLKSMVTYLTHVLPLDRGALGRSGAGKRQHSLPARRGRSPQEFWMDAAVSQTAKQNITVSLEEKDWMRTYSEKGSRAISEEIEEHLCYFTLPSGISIFYRLLPWETMEDSISTT